MATADGDIEVDNVYEDLDKNVHQYANQDEIDEELRQTGTRRKEQTNIGKNNTRPGNVRWFCNVMFVSGCSGQDENNDSTDTADTSAIPNDTSRRSYRLQWAIAVMLATLIGVGVGLVTYYKTVQETQPFSHNSPPVRWGTSSRPVSTVPVTSIGSTMENRNDTITDLLLLQVGARTTSQYLKTMPKVETTLFRVTTTLPNGTTTPAEVTTTSPEVTTTLPEVTTTLPEVTTTLPEVTTTLPEVTTTLPEVTTTLSEVTTTLPELTTTLPKVTTTLPKVTTTMPKVTTTLPKMTTTPPEVFPDNVKRTTFDQIHKNTEPQPLTIQEGDRYHSLGCWKDHSSRAIPTLEGLDSRLEGSYRTRSNAVEKCYQAAKSRSFTVFAVQHGGQCYGSADGHNTYFKYGRSTACQAGDGGTWANDVYRITTRTGVNIALGKRTAQSSTFSFNENLPGNARLAVDGNTASNHHYGSCTHTKNLPGEMNASWWVDLGQPYAIGRVVIFNRMDCCSERLNPFNIHIGDSDKVSTNPMCGDYHQIDVKRPSISVSCQGMKGRYVAVRLPYNHNCRILSLCEVQVFSVTWNMRNGGCQDGYIRVGWACIKLVSSPKSFWDAKQACVEEGATLAMPRTEEFDHALRRHIKLSAQLGYSELWIGLTVTVTGFWFGSKEYNWVDGVPLLGQYRGWHPGEPTDVKNLRNGDWLCIQYWYSGRTSDPMWDDAKCTKKKQYICQSSPA